MSHVRNRPIANRHSQGVWEIKRIPFLPRFHDPIRKGEKTMTSRTREYGKPGEVLEIVDGLYIQLIDVRWVMLGDVARGLFTQEGCSSPQEFIKIWEEIHPVGGFDPKMLVAVHEFTVVPE